MATRFEKHSPLRTCSLPPCSPILRPAWLKTFMLLKRLPFAGQGETPLLYACHSKEYAVGSLLIEFGADVGARNKEGNTCLHLICKQTKTPHAADFADFARLLIQKGAEVNAKNKDDDTPLHYAFKKNVPGVVSLLLENGADSNSLNKAVR
eukprot:m.145752 g.145752  ORF g.145752 m.145752 type:complete len:151 (-) comp16067_c0_seq9:2920-3372(-)